MTPPPRTLTGGELKEIYAPIEGDLRAFAETYRNELVSSDELIRSIHEHLLRMSGKTLRPALAFFAYRLGGRENRRIVPLAVAVELIHTATLIHDDIIDDSALRRNQPTIYSKWGQEISIVTGDYLYAKAFLLLAGLKDSWVNETFAACAHRMCEGELKQIEKRSDYLMKEEEYYRIIDLKTAALFRAACMAGAYFGGLPETGILALGRYGYNLGQAFQIVDDCLDLIGEVESFGKTQGLDIYKNDVTLPVLYLFQSLGEADRRRLVDGVQNDGRESFRRIRQMAVESKAVERATQKARAFADQAQAELGDLPGSPFQEGLQQLTRYCVERSR